MIPDKDGFFGLLALATIPLALFAIFYGEKISKKYKFSNRNKIIFNLIILFLLTILIDLLLYQKLATLEYFIQGGGKIRLLG
ncbi:hypothetical protein HYX00_00220 [Candidatus Woesearchaeota archaeon]|nr:hypothetical protein [Candidatus Woesearchaeota archaeon]